MTPEYNQTVANIIGSSVGGGDPDGDKKKKAAAAKAKAAAATTTPQATVTTTNTGLGVSADVNKLTDNQPNYFPTKDPNIFTGRYGATITRDQFLQNQKGTMPFNSFEDYANWVGGWAGKPATPPLVPAKPLPQKDYYEGYSTPGSGAMRYHQN